MKTSILSTGNTSKVQHANIEAISINVVHCFSSLGCGRAVNIISYWIWYVHFQLC